MVRRAATTGLHEYHGSKNEADTRRQFLRACFVSYGAGFGAIYAVLLGLSAFAFSLASSGMQFASPSGDATMIFEFLGGEIATALFGLVCGVVFGFITGLIIGARAARLTIQGSSTMQIARAVRRLGPAITAASSFLVITTFGALTGNGALVFAVPFINIVWIVASVAAGHASVLIARQFAQEYE